MGVIYDTADPTRWVKPSLIWVPHCDGIIRQIFLALVERYKQYYFAQCCWAEMLRRARENKYLKCTYIQLSDSHGLRREQNDAIQWLSSQSMDIDADVGQDALQNWLEKLLALPAHIQIQRAGATREAIQHGSSDIRRKGGQHKPTYLADEPNEPIDESTIEADKGIDVETLLQRLQSRRSQIEKLLSKGQTTAR